MIIQKNNNLRNIKKILNYLYLETKNEIVEKNKSVLEIIQCKNIIN